MISAGENTADVAALAFRAYVKDRRIVIADASSVSRANLAQTLVNLGAKSANLALSSSYADAEAEIARTKPQIVVCDYDLGNQRGLDLLQRQRTCNEGSKDTLFVLVTGNSSQTAVARAAEEDVDTYILKPFTAAVLRASLIRAALAKSIPNEYARTIDEGKKLLAANQFDDALKAFERAISLDQAPALACFYFGQTQLMKQATEVAEDSYNKGLTYNRIHYKCMVGLFDLFMSQKRHIDAYETVKRISQYFPANPARLNSVLKLAIMTQSYDDVEKYYQMFTKLDERNDEIIKHVCAALVVCGKYYLQKNFKSRAIELFNKAAVTAGGRVKILQEIIFALVEHKLGKDAQVFIQRFPPETHETSTYLALELLIADQLVENVGVVLQKARALVSQGIHDPIISEILIRRSVEAGFQDTAENEARAAAQRYPDQKNFFERLPRSKPKA